VNQVKENRYIFIYGGSNSAWIQNFTHELSKIKMNESIQRADIIIEYCQLGKGKSEPNNSVPSFWIGVERKKQNKKHQEAVDCEIQKIVKCLFCLKRDPQGWAILSKGHNIKHLCHGQAVYQTVAEFQNWKGKVFEREGFDIAFKEYYDAKEKEISAIQPCEDYTSTSSVIATITCPNPTCGRVMEVSSVNYKCCHRDDAFSCWLSTGRRSIRAPVSFSWTSEFCSRFALFAMHGVIYYILPTWFTPSMGRQS